VPVPDQVPPDDVSDGGIVVDDDDTAGRIRVIHQGRPPFISTALVTPTS
jgi:hypothetical protein